MVGSVHWEPRLGVKRLSGERADEGELEGWGMVVRKWVPKIEIVEECGDQTCQGQDKTMNWVVQVGWR